MSTPGLSFRSGGAEIELSPSGSLIAVRHDDRPGHVYLAAGGQPSARVDGLEIGWAEPQVTADIDEVEFVFRGGPLVVAVRHSFASSWGVRVAVASRSDAPIRVESAGLTWVPAPDSPAWALAAGATGMYAVMPPDAEGPLLGGLLTLGTCAQAGPAGIDFGPVELEPGGRFVVGWQWDWYASALPFDARRDPGVPRSLAMLVGDAAVIRTDADTALVLSAGIAQDEDPAGAELSSWQVGSHQVELVSARGVTRYDVHAADPLPEVTQAAASQALLAPLTPAGIVALPDASAALAVSQAMRAGAADPATAEEALDLFVARSLTAETGDPVMISLLVGEYERAGDPDLLEACTRWLRRTTTPTPGLGLAATQVCVARMLRGLEIRAILGALRELAESPPLSREDALARLELHLVAAPVDPAVDWSALAEVGRWLGCGLTGRPVRPLSEDYLAHAAAVLGLTTEPVSRELGRGWPMTAHELARQTRAEVLYRLAGRPAGPALALMIMAARSD